jgi:hypothetical protein
MLDRMLEELRRTAMRGRSVVCQGALLLALLSQPAATSAATDLHVIHGEWAGDIAVDGKPGDPCDDPSGTLVAGNTVELTDADGLPLGATELRDGAVNNEGHCSYGFTLWGVPEHDAYFVGVTLGGRAKMEPVKVTLRRMEANDWMFERTIQTSVYLEATGGIPASSSSNTPLTTTVAPTPSPQPTVSVSPTAASQTSITPRGEALVANGWEISVADAYILPDPPGTSLAYNIVVTLNVRNTGSSLKNFGKPDMDLSLTSEQGWGGQYDIFKTAETSVALGEWSGAYSPGFDYQFTAVFSVWKWDPNLYTEGLSGWILTIEDGDATYVLEVGDLPQP